MAAFTAELQDTDNKFFTPEQGISDRAYDGSASIQRFGELTELGVTSFLGGRLENKMKDLRQDFLDEEASYSPQELGAIEDATARFEKMKQMASQTGRNSEFKIRAEALMKEYINTMPGLANEFRRISSGVLGFDPTGSELNEQMRAIEEASMDTKKLMEQMNNDAVGSFGMLPGEIYTPEGKQKYLLNVRVRERMKELQTMSQLQQMTEEDMDIQGELARNTWQVRQGIQQTVASTMLEVFTSPAIGFAPEALQNGLTSEMVMSLSPDQRRGAISSLDEVEARVKAEFQQYRQHFARVEDYNTWEEQVLAPIQMKRRALNGEIPMEDVEITQRNLEAGMRQELLKHPWYVTQTLLNEIGIQLPDFKSVQHFEDAIGVFETVFNPNPDQFRRNLEGLTGAQVTPEVVGSVMENFLVNYERAFGEEGTTEQQNFVVESLVNFAEMMASDKGYSATTMRKFMTSLSDPTNIEMFQKVNEQFPDVFLHVQRAATNFSTQAARAAEQRIENTIEKTSYGVVEEATWMNEYRNELVEAYIENGQVKLRLSEEKWSEYMSQVPPPDNRFGRRRRESQRDDIAKEIDRANRYALNDLNKSTRALVNLTGQPVEQQLSVLLGRTSLGNRLGLQAPVSSSQPRSTPTPSSPTSTPNAPQGEPVGEAPEGVADGVYTDSNGNTVRVSGGKVYEL